MKVVEKSLDCQLWHACAGSMVQMPPVNSKVFYLPQGHAEHALTNIDFGGLPRIPALILCRIAALKFMADPETDEVYAKITLVPLGNNEPDYDEDGSLGSNSGSESPEKPASFAKTLTQSDANNGGGFSVPRYCAETIFPRLDYTADPPVQTVIAKDVHGEVWKFRHIYRGTPRRHLLTTGWSTFVNQKKLVAGDSVVFLRANNGDLCVGIRRAKRGGIGGSDCPSGWCSAAGSSVSSYGMFSGLSREDENKLGRSGSNGNLKSSLKRGGKVIPESVIEAVSHAISGHPFEVLFYPRANTPEFCIKASSVTDAMRIQWCPGMRFKMAFETEDSSRISWFMGTIASVQVADPINWPNSPWRLLQVRWDEPDLLQNVKCVSPWLVELVSNMPVIHLPSFSLPRKKLRLQQHPEHLFDGQFSGNPLGPPSPLCYPSQNIPAGIQGARHAQFGMSSTDLHLSNKLQLGLFPPSFLQVDPHAKASECVVRGHVTNDNVSCLLTVGNTNHELERTDNTKTPRFLLFGQPILTEQQISCGLSTGKPSKTPNERPSSDECFKKAQISLFDPKNNSDILSHVGFLWKQGFHAAELGLETGHCKVFLESEDVGRTLDLSVLGSYEELYRRLANMFGIERSEVINHVLYRDATGAVQKTGDEPFSEFMKTAKRLTIFMDSGSSSKNVGRKWTGLGSAEHGLDSSKQTGPLSIFA